MLKLLNSRRYLLSALLITLLTLYTLVSRQEWDSEWMLKWNGVNTRQAQLVYGVLAGVLVPAVPFEPRIRAAARRGWPVVLVLAAVVSFLIVRLLEPDQEHRLFITPFSIWVMIAHGVGLAALAVGMANSSGARLQYNARRYGLVILLLLGLGLIALHIATVGELMKLDLPDEPWLSSMATNYAENNDLSPSFIGSSYGSPDPVLPRYYWLMGLWVQVVGSSLTSLRWFPLLMGAMMVAITGLMLWRHPQLTTAQKLIGIIVLLSLSAVVRMSHNLRADIGLGLYGALTLWGLLHIFGKQTHSKQWALIMGLALIAGLETIPFLTLILAIVTGGLLIIWVLYNQRWRSDWQMIVIYALCCALAIGIYVAIRLLPDIQAGLSGLQRFNRVYNSQSNLGSFRSPLADIVNYHLRFSLILSPVEFIFISGTIISLWYRGSSAERWTVTVFGLAIGIAMFFVSVAFGYWVLFAPLVAYAATRSFDVRTFAYPHPPTPSPLHGEGEKNYTKAKVLDVKSLAVIGKFVLLPALAAAPIYDMIAAVQSHPNRTRLEAISLVAPLIPEGTTLVGDEVLWFTLHSRRHFIGVDGFWIYFGGHVNYTIRQAMMELGVDALICRQGDTRCLAFVETEWFDEPTFHTFGDVTYELYWSAGNGSKVVDEGYRTTYLKQIDVILSNFTMT